MRFLVPVAAAVAVLFQKPEQLEHHPDAEFIRSRVSCFEACWPERRQRQQPVVAF